VRLVSLLRVKYMRLSLLVRAAKRANAISRTNVMSRGIGSVSLGLFVLALSWIVWKTTGSFWGWLGLFLPGGVYVLVGCAWVVVDE
jgi:hypothetical protein